MGHWPRAVLMLGRHRWRWVNALCWLSSEYVDKSQTCIDRVSRYAYSFGGGGGVKKVALCGEKTHRPLRWANIEGHDLLMKSDAIV